MNIIPKSADYPWSSIKVDTARLLKALADCRRAGVTYGLGAKAPSLSSSPSQFKAIDCSGFVRWALYQATGGSFVLTDGSVQQHETIAAAGFKRSAPDACAAQDGILRIAFLPPKDKEPGHVLLTLNGKSIESHGNGVGPDSRPVSSLGFLPRCDVFVLTRAPGATT